MCGIEFMVPGLSCTTVFCLDISVSLDALYIAAAVLSDCSCDIILTFFTRVKLEITNAHTKTIYSIILCFGRFISY